MRTDEQILSSSLSTYTRLGSAHKKESDRGENQIGGTEKQRIWHRKRNKKIRMSRVMRRIVRYVTLFLHAEWTLGSFHKRRTRSCRLTKKAQFFLWERWWSMAVRSTTESSIACKRERSNHQKQGTTMKKRRKRSTGGSVNVTNDSKGATLVPAEKLDCRHWWRDPSSEWSWSTNSWMNN